MSSKLFTTVLLVVTIGPFIHLATADAVSIKHNLQKQNTHIQQLSVESAKLDKELGKTTETKEQTKQQVQQLDQQTQDAINERQRLEAELGAN